MVLFTRISAIPLEALEELTRSSTDFDCIPRSLQVKFFVEFLASQGNDIFSCQEISEMFVKADMKSPCSDRKIRCSGTKVRKYLEMLVRWGDLNIQKISETQYKQN